MMHPAPPLGMKKTRREHLRFPTPTMTMTHYSKPPIRHWSSRGFPTAARHSSILPVGGGGVGGSWKSSTTLSRRHALEHVTGKIYQNLSYLFISNQREWYWWISLQTTYQYLRLWSLWSVWCGFKPYCSRKLENNQDHLRVWWACSGSNGAGIFGESLGNFGCTCGWTAIPMSFWTSSSELVCT